MAVWTVHVHRLDGTLPDGDEVDYDNFTEITQWTGLKFSTVLNDAGAASLSMDFDSAEFLDPVDGPDKLIAVRDQQNIVKFLRDGETRFSFIPDELDETYVQDDETKPFTISGRCAPAALLEMGTVIPIGYPAQTQLHHEWVDEFPMSIWLDLFDEANFRDAMSSIVQITFTHTDDSFSIPWVDTVSIKLNPGSDLFTLLKRFAEMADADFFFNAELDQLGITLDHGNDLSAPSFEVGETQLVNIVKRNRKGIANYIYLQGAQGIFKGHEHLPSEGIWGKREFFFESGNVADFDTATFVLDRVVEQTKTEIVSITVKVLPEFTSLVVFEDYDVGTWVWIRNPDPALDDTYRILAISVAVDDEGKEDVELTLQSRSEARLVSMQKQLERDGANSRINTEMQVANRDLGSGSSGIPAFNQPAAVTLGTSPRWKNKTGADLPIGNVVITLQVAGTTGTTVRIRLNGTTSESFTIPAATNEIELTPATVTNLPSNEYIDVAVITVGTGAQALDVQIV